eukprot:4357097-Pyramimonas_sp.AAC.1
MEAMAHIAADLPIPVALVAVDPAPPPRRSRADMLAKWADEVNKSLQAASQHLGSRLAAKKVSLVLVTAPGEQDAEEADDDAPAVVRPRWFHCDVVETRTGRLLRLDERNRI